MSRSPGRRARTGTSPNADATASAPATGRRSTARPVGFPDITEPIGPCSPQQGVVWWASPALQEPLRLVLRARDGLQTPTVAKKFLVKAFRRSSTSPEDGGPTKHAGRHPERVTERPEPGRSSSASARASTAQPGAYHWLRDTCLKLARRCCGSTRDGLEPLGDPLGAIRPPWRPWW
jgi:hypothetical protein